MIQCMLVQREIEHGVEVMAVIFAKRLGITVGTFVMAYNIVLYICCGIAIHSWILPLYSIVTYAAALKTVDFIVEGFDRAKCAMIITDNPDEICSLLTEAFESGMTRIEVRGGYSGESKTMIYFIVNRFQVAKCKDLVHRADPAAYIAISEVADVYAANHGKS
ncbi:MAG: YitT family protein [Oscillospiraceae bacterium]|nr:YitT family protein [Oscillospiraceae bacterium]